MKKIFVDFQGGESRSRLDNTQGVDWMLADAVNKESEEVELCAEVELIDSPYAIPFRKNNTLEEIQETSDENSVYRPLFRELLELDESDLEELLDSGRLHEMTNDFFEENNLAELFSKWAYPQLKEEIIRQAVENGIDPELLEFFCD